MPANFQNVFDKFTEYAIWLIIILAIGIGIILAYKFIKMLIYLCQYWHLQYLRFKQVHQTIKNVQQDLNQANMQQTQNEPKTIHAQEEDVEHKKFKSRQL